MTPLDELFMAETMTTMVEEFADQSEDHSYIGVYEAGEPILPTADDFIFKEVTYSRGMAPITGTQSPSKPHEPLGVKKRAGQVYAIKEHVDLPAPLLMMAQGKNADMPDPEGWLAGNLRNLTNRVQRTRNYWAAQSFLTGSVDLANFPNADVPGSTVLTYPVQTLSATNTWATPANAIRPQTATLHETYKRKTGFAAATAIASKSVEGYITNNTAISQTVDQVQTLAQRKIELSYLEGGSLIRFGGLDWRFVDDYYVTDANERSADAADTAATTTDMASDGDLVTILPPASRYFECFGQALGRVFVPNGLITSLAVGTPAGLFSELRGWYAYLELLMNPIGLRLHVGWHGSLVQRRRNAVMVYNTTP